MTRTPDRSGPDGPRPRARPGAWLALAALLVPGLTPLPLVGQADRDPRMTGIAEVGHQADVHADLLGDADDVVV